MISDPRIVGGNNDCLAGRSELSDDRHEMVAELFIQVSGRLIGNDYRRIIDQCPGNCRALQFNRLKYELCQNLSDGSATVWPSVAPRAAGAQPGYPRGSSGMVMFAATLSPGIR